MFDNRKLIFFAVVSSFMFISATVSAYVWYTESAEILYFISLFWFLIWIAFLVIGYKTSITDVKFVNWYYVWSNWNKYKWDWSNWSANWNWRFELSDWSILEWVFKDWKLNWEWKSIFTNWEIWEWNFIDWVPNWKFKVICSNWDIITWNFVWWKKHWVCKHIFKKWWSLSGNYTDDLPDWDFTIVTGNCSIFKAHYEHWKKIWELEPIDVKDKYSLVDDYSNVDAEKLKDLMDYLSPLLHKYQLDINTLLKNRKNKFKKSFDEKISDVLVDWNEILRKLSDNDFILKEIVEKDIDYLEKILEKIKSFNWCESKSNLEYISASNHVNWYFDLVKSVFKKHHVKLRDKTKYSYWEYYQNLQKLNKNYNNFVVKLNDASFYVFNIRNNISKSDDPMIYDKIKVTVKKLYDDYYNQFKKFIEINDSLDIYFDEFWKFHTKW